jgi:hypothetical protein
MRVRGSDYPLCRSNRCDLTLRPAAGGVVTQRAGSLTLTLRLFLDKMSEKRVANVGCLILARAKGPGLCTSQPNTDKPAAPLHHASGLHPDWKAGELSS